MTQTKTKDPATPSQQRTVLLAVDLKNSVLAEVDAGNTNRIAYSPYGHQSAQHEVISQLGFNGERRETMPGWYFLGNGYRVYNPRLMRFHSPDNMSPFGKGGLNAYMYCGGEPVMNSDPTGHFFGMFRKLITAAGAAMFASNVDDAFALTGRLKASLSATPASSATFKSISNEGTGLIPPRLSKTSNAGKGQYHSNTGLHGPGPSPGLGDSSSSGLGGGGYRSSGFGPNRSSSSSGIGAPAAKNSGDHGYANRTPLPSNQPKPQTHRYTYRTEVTPNQPKPPRITSTTAGIRKNN